MKHRLAILRNCISSNISTKELRQRPVTLSLQSMAEDADPPLRSIRVKQVVGNLCRGCWGAYIHQSPASAASSLYFTARRHAYLWCLYVPCSPSHSQCSPSDCHCCRNYTKHVNVEVELSKHIRNPVEIDSIICLNTFINPGKWIQLSQSLNKCPFHGMGMSFSLSVKTHSSFWAFRKSTNSGFFFFTGRWQSDWKKN